MKTATRPFHWKGVLVSLALLLPLSLSVSMPRVETIFPPGASLDTTVSEILSRRLDCRVSVTGVRLPSWRKITFEASSVMDREGSPLLSSGPGSLELKRLHWKRPRGIATSVSVRDVSLSKRVYQRSRALSAWLPLMRKPLTLESLQLWILQNKRYTEVRVLECSKGHFLLGGQIILERSTVVRDELRASLSAFGVLRSIF